MAIYIEIKKTKFSDDIYYYGVKTTTLNGPQSFFIGIDTKRKVFNVYKKDINNKPDFSIDLERPYIDENAYDKTFQNILVRVLAKAIKAYKDNSYSEYISFEA